MKAIIRNDRSGILDPQLYSAILIETHCAPDELNKRALASIKSLSCTGKLAMCLEGIDLLKNLEHVSFRHCGVYDIQPLYACRKLKMLDLAFNNISDLDGISSMPLLENLNLAHNDYIDEVNLEGLPHLKGLSLAGNALRSLSLVDLPQLRILKFDDYIRNIHLENLPHIRKIVLTDLNYHNIFISRMKRLEKVVIGYAQQIEIAGIPSMRDLEIGGVNLIVHDLPKSLVELSLMNATPQPLPNISHLKNMRSLTLNGYEGLTVKKIQELPSLKELILYKPVSLDFLKLYPKIPKIQLALDNVVEISQLMRCPTKSRVSCIQNPYGYTLTITKPKGSRSR